MCRVSKNGRGAKQTVSLSGMGLEVFAENVTAVLHLYQLLDGCLAQGTLQPWKPALHHGHASLEFSNLGELAIKWQIRFLSGFPYNPAFCVFLFIFVFFITFL